jgi:UDP-N-acetylglucosamine 2-epimerase (non-hydrolysing)
MKTPVLGCVIGTRPEALKMIPVIEALQNHTPCVVRTIITGQHRELLAQMLKDSSIAIDANFDVMQYDQSLSALSAKLFSQFDKYLMQEPCDLIIAQGDTTTTLVAAQAAFYKKIPFAHVEAGLRTSSLHNPFPEEFNRRTTSMIATLHFCPTQKAQRNLAKEGIKEGVYITGNTIIDTLYKHVQNLPNVQEEQKRILITCHRRENFGAPLQAICRALQILAWAHPEIELLFPVHPNPHVYDTVYSYLKNIANIKLCAPMDYPTLVKNMKNAYCILTDSGGLQEEGPALGKPVLILREETERPEGVDVGAARLVGTETHAIVAAVEELLSDVSLYQKMQNAGSPYGDGWASLRIVSIIAAFLGVSPHNMPSAFLKETLLFS